MWRNDVKDFMNGKKNLCNLEVLEIVLEVKDTSDIISVKLDRPDLIFGITFILTPKGCIHLDGKYIIHPITKEEIPIFLEKLDLDYRYYLRHYQTRMEETILYAV